MRASEEESPPRFGLQCLGLVLPLALTANGCRPAFSEISPSSALSHFGMKAFRQMQLMENMGAKLGRVAKEGIILFRAKCFVAERGNSLAADGPMVG